ncbi:HipA domain-containing protein [Chromobacterium sphagni]|nr:HipA domain-containing protein [Chromobacterium sphagni]
MMQLNGRQLMVYINSQIVGHLAEAGNVWSFQYDSSWLQLDSAFPLSPHLPLQEEQLLDGATHRPVQWYFDNLLPESAHREALAKDANVTTGDAFGLLEHYGEESAGSLTLLPIGTAVPAGGQRRLLDDANLTRRIEDLPRLPLTHEALKRMSLAGAQNKLAVVYEDGVLYEPEGASMSTHILKPNHEHPAYPHSVINEWFVMKLASRLRNTHLKVPTVYRHYTPLPVYLVERFDRVEKNGSWERLHIIDACQLDNLAAIYKYSQGSLERLQSFVGRCRIQAQVRLKLFEWLVFNVLVGNTDAHLKNLSFFMTSSGIDLTPTYDLLSEAVYETDAVRDEGGANWKHREMAWPLDEGVVRLEQMSRKVLVDAGVKVGLPAKVAETVLNNLQGQIFEQAKQLHDEMTAENAHLRQHRSELAHRLNGEERLVRTIVYVIIQEMAQQLA